MLSIIIPTYNRLEILKRCLSAIDLQEEVDLANDVEVIVVDDGGRDGTGEWLNENTEAFRFALRPLRQDNAGQGNARNYGLNEAKGDIVMFLGDDIFLHPRALSRHLRVHAEHPAPEFAVLGFTTWHPELRVTNFMYFLEHGGHQFKYGAIGRTFHERTFEPSAAVDNDHPLFEAEFWFFYTSNISLKAALINGTSSEIAAVASLPRNDEPMRFEPVYTSYGWEDTDFGYRLQKEKGMRIIYDPSIKAWHHHEVTIDGFQKRMKSIAKNAQTFHRRFPEVPILPSGFKKLAFRILALSPVLLVLRAAAAISSRAERFYFYALSKKYWLEGLR